MTLWWRFFFRFVLVVFWKRFDLRLLPIAVRGLVKNFAEGLNFKPESIAFFVLPNYTSTVRKAIPSRDWPIHAERKRIETE